MKNIGAQTAEKKAGPAVEALEKKKEERRAMRSMPLHRALRKQREVAKRLPDGRCPLCGRKVWDCYCDPAKVEEALDECDEKRKCRSSRREKELRLEKRRSARVRVSPTAVVDFRVAEEAPDYEAIDRRYGEEIAQAEASA